MLTVMKQVYDHIVQHKTGTHFNSVTVAKKLGFDVRPVSAALNRLEKNQILKAIGRRSRTFIYKYVSHEHIRFKKRYTERKTYNRRCGDAHIIRNLPLIDGEDELVIRRKRFLPDDDKPLSERLLDIAIELGFIPPPSRPRNTHSSGGRVVNFPPQQERKAKPFLPSDLKSLSERLLDLAVEVEKLESRLHKCEDSKVETGG